MVRGPYSMGACDKHGGLIADCKGYYLPEEFANARLIAAAPELYEAGVRVIAAFEAHGKARGPLDEQIATRRECEAAMLALKSSLAKVGAA